jgi:DNA-binding transcriptional LysR family regulator
VFTLEQVRCFVAVAEELSFRRAADRLVMSQPPLSRQVQRLEQNLGARLLARTTRSVELTAAGAVFLEHAREILTLCDDARRTTQATAVGTHGRIRVGFTTVAALGASSSWLRVMRADLPNVEVALREAASSAQVDLLLAGHLDLAFVRGVPIPPVVTSRTVHVETLVLAVPATHELTRLGRPPRLADVARHDLVGYGPSPGRYFHELSISLFQQAGLTPRHAQYVNEISSILLLVEAGLGVALVPRSAAKLWTADRLVFLPVDDVPDDVVQLRAAWRSDRVSPALTAGIARLPSPQPRTMLEPI